MKRYGQFCPIARACEVFAERWTPLVVRELVRGSSRFSEIQRGVPLMSRTLLVQRLRALEEAGIVRSRPREDGRGREYRLTRAGEELRPLLLGLGRWGERWTRRRLESTDLDAGLLLWSIRALARKLANPSRRVVIRIELTGLPRGQRTHSTSWLILETGAADLCLTDPGFEVNLLMRADLGALTRCYLGHCSLAEAEQEGSLSFEGPRELVRATPGWLGFDGFRVRRDPLAPMARAIAASEAAKITARVPA